MLVRPNHDAFFENLTRRGGEGHRFCVAPPEQSSHSEQSLKNFSTPTGRGYEGLLDGILKPESLTIRDYIILLPSSLELLDRYLNGLVSSNEAEVLCIL